MSSIRDAIMLTFGSGLLNKVINKLPFEAHLKLPFEQTYSYCGPGTRLQERLARGIKGINPLDEACKQHDIAYSQHDDLNKRHEADKILAKRAVERVKESPSIKEKLAALLVAGAMKAKTKLGMGMKRKRRRSHAVGFGSRKKKRKSQ